MKVTTSREVKIDIIEMRNMERGVLYELVPSGEIVIGYNHMIAVNLSKPREGKIRIWSAAHACTLKVKRCEPGFSITLEQDE